MEKHPNPFDDFLKEALKGHQLVPPEKAKEAFLKEASTIIITRKGWFKWYFIPIMVIFIAGFFTVIFILEEDEQTPSGTAISDGKPSVSITDASSTSDTLTLSSDTTTNSKSTSVFTQNTEKQLNADVSLLPVENKITKENKSIDIAADLLANPTAGNDTAYSKTTSSKLALDSLSITVIGIADTIAEPLSPVSDTTSTLPNGENTNTRKPIRANQIPYFTTGVYYLPEWMFNTVEGTKFVNNFGAEATFYRGPVSIRTGAGFSISKGITKNAVEYNDYLGSYNKLDSITFTFSESEHNFLPNLYMSSEKVWDSLSQLDSADVIKRYTYLQIPLILGFDFWQRGKFSAGVRIGTIMSVLLNSKQLSENYNPGENQVIGINRITPEQVSINWQAIGGINASARLTRNIFFEIEPQARYYYQSIYEESDMTKKPWSVGIRMAVIYKF